MNTETNVNDHRRPDGSDEEVVRPEVDVVVQADEVADPDADGVVEAEVERPGERVADQPEQQQHHRQDEHVRRRPVTPEERWDDLEPRARRGTGRAARLTYSRGCVVGVATA